MTAILAEPSLLIGYCTTAQMQSGGNIQSANLSPFEILGISPLTKPSVNAITLNPPKLSLVADLGAGVPDNTVQVAPPGKWLATTITPWLEIHCATGNCGSFFIVRFRIDGLKPGNYNGEVKVAAGNDSVILPVSLKISMMGNGDTISTSIGRPTDTPGTPNYPTNSNPKIVAFGDSITYGYPLAAQQSYPNLLQKKIAADEFNFEVVNAGVNGETSAGGLQRIDSVLDAMRNIKIVVLELGINDQSGIPAALTKQNLSQIIKKIKAKNISVVLCETAVPSSSAEYKAVFEQLKTEHNLPFVANILEGTSTSDGLHPTVSGAVFMTEKIYTTLKSVLRKRNTPPTPPPTPTPVTTSQSLMYRNPNNPHRWMLNGKPFYPLGIGDCVYRRGANNEILMGLDGDATPKFTDLDTYFGAYSAAGFNLLRVSVNNCSFELNTEANWLLMDTYISKARQYGFQIQFCFFNYYFYGNQLDYVRRCIKRYDKDVAIWELANETQSTDAEITSGANYIKSIDAKKRPVTVSFHPTNLPILHDIPAIDVSSPHWYQDDKSEFSFDQDFVDRFSKLKNWGKPIIVGEYGLSSANWSPISSLQLRLASWAAFFNEVGLCFWNTSWDKNLKTEGASNFYLGKQERAAIKVLVDFIGQVPGDAKIVKTAINKPALVRAFALSSGNGYFAYLHAFTNHQSQTSGITMTIEPKTAGYAIWIAPANGRVLATAKVSAGRQTLGVPPFLIDVALKVSGSQVGKK